MLAASWTLPQHETIQKLAKFNTANADTRYKKKSTVPPALWRLGGEHLHFLADTSVSKFVSALVACCLIFWSFDRLRVSNISFPPMSRMRVLLVAEEQVEYEGKSGRCWFVWYFVYS